jgi:hypothetical protein
MKHSSQSTCIHSSTYLQSAPCINPLQKGQGRQPGTALGFSPHTHKKTDRQAVQQGQDMEARYPGDPRGRPARAHCAVAATGSIRRHRDDMINKAVVCSFDENNHEVDSLQAGDMLREKFNLHHGQYQIVKYFPEQFFIIFSDPRSKQWTLDQNSVSYRGRVFHFGDWSEESYARKTFFEFRVKVRVEGVPVHCWGEDVVARVLGKSCAIHYVQERARRREHTRSFDLWAWCSDPCEIPKEVWLTVTEPDREPPPVSTPLPLAGVNYDVPSDLKKGHVYTLRNHIEIVEDLSFLCGGGGGGARGDLQTVSLAESLNGAMVFQIPLARKESIRVNVVEGIWLAATGIKMMMMSINMVEDTVLVVIAAFLVGFVRRVVGVGLMTASAPMENTELPLPSDVMRWGCHTCSIGFLN